MENVSSYIMFFIIVEFPVNKEGLIYWKQTRKKNPSDVLPHALQEDLDALSSVLLYSRFTLHMYASSMGRIRLPGECLSQRIPFRSHSARLISLPEHHVRDHVVFLTFWLNFFHECPAGSSSAVWHHVLLCLSGPYAASHQSTRSSYQRQTVWIPSSDTTEKLLVYRFQWTDC